MSKKTKFDDMVIFGDGMGGFVSNDPKFDPEEYNEHLNGASETSDDESEAGPYDGLDGKALKALAAEREVDIKGLKTKSEVVAALTAADAESEDESEGDSEDETSEDN